MSSGPATRRSRGRPPGLTPVAVAALFLSVACATGGTPRNFGAGSGSLDWAGLRFDVHLLPSPLDQLRARISVTNTEDHFLVREIPFCVARLRVYRDGAVLWDQGGDECFGRRIVRLTAGEAEHYWTRASAREVLPEGTDRGTFTVRAYWPPEHHPDRVPRTEMEITVGRIRLERP